MSYKKIEYIISKLKTLREKINDETLIKYINEIIDICNMEHLE